MTETTEPTPEGLEPGPAPVTVAMAARALGLTPSHIHARIRAGTIHAVNGPAKGGGTQRMIPRAEIERLIAEQGGRAHGPVKPEPADTRPILQLERVTQRLESTRAVLADAVEVIAEDAGEEPQEAGGWWGRARREREQAARREAALRERLARLEAALRAAHAAAESTPEDTSE